MTQKPMAGPGPKGGASARRIEVDPERVVRWVTGFAERHGEVHQGQVHLGEAVGPAVVLTAADGATAILEPFLPVFRAPGDAPADSRGDMPGEAPGHAPRSSTGDMLALARWVEPPSKLALILVRRGGYAVGVGRGPELIAHKVGTRYVQSRTAAGGWSQHRFARRRDNQADALVISVIEHCLRVVLTQRTDALVVGGDKSLIRDVLADPRLARLARLPRRQLFDLPDPKLVVLKQALRRGRAVRITLSEPAAPPPD